MLVEFLLILLFYQLIGDCLLQIDRILFKRKIERFTLLEQFVFGLIFGIFISTLFTILVVYIGPFNFYLLLFLDLIFLIICIVINQRSFKGFFYWRVYKLLKIKEKSTIGWQYYKRFILFFIGIVILDLYIKSFTYKFEHIDLLAYANYALDSIRNGWNLYDPNYFFTGQKIRIFTFLLIPFYAIAPSEWIFISGNYLFQLQLFLFFTLVFIILYKFDSKFSILLVFFITAATVIFPSWFTYFLPSNFFIVLLLGLIILLFNKDKRSLFLEVILFLFMFMIHIPSIIAMYLIPFSITLIIIWYKNPEALFKNYQEKKARIKSFIKKNRWKVLFLVITMIISATIFIIISFSFIVSLWNKYIKLDVGIATFPPLIVWQGMTLGLIINITTLGCFLYLLKKKLIKINKYQILFFVILNLYLTIYLTGFDFWNDIIRTTYYEYRFVLHLDVSLIVLIPILFSIIKKNTHFLNKYEYYIKCKLFLINDYLKKYNLNLLFVFNRFNNYLKKKRIDLRKHINISKITNISIFLLILFYCTIKAIPNYNKRYYHRLFEEYWFDEYHYATVFLNDIALGYETYIYNKFTPFTHTRLHMATFLGDLRCINYDQMKKYYLDDRYKTNNSGYENFLNFIFNDTKLINTNQGNYKNLPIYLRIAKTVDYILIDSFSNPNLCKLMENDTTHFEKIFQCRIIKSLYVLTSEDPEIFVYIFKSKN